VGGVSERQGDVELLADRLAQQLLSSTALARLAYLSIDGTPRVVPIWFHWTGEVVVMASPQLAPKIGALRRAPRVAITIDETPFPYRVLLLRGDARVGWVQGVPDEYTAAARRYFGADQGSAWVARMDRPGTRMARIEVRPDWVGLLDFERRFPSALLSHLAAGSSEEGR
jgi:PPOX class probable F420-dependent enzyme